MTETGTAAWGVTAQSLASIRAGIRDVPDYPEPGILFKDITPLLADPQAFRATVDAFAGMCTELGADKILGLEARGFIMGAPAAVLAGAGFIPVRKAGKLPRTTFSQAYQLEYGTAELEMHEDAIAPGERVLIVDDVLATGGTVEASTELVRKAGGELAGVAVLMELTALGGRRRLTSSLPGVPVSSLLTF
ncbi:adenine phosphoribosyltransferase [Streptomyces sp. NPDC026206]|uniref:adenine phosphoribosyltransferase n=1 Tax=Streptomyces sp. NPDC026206 TaxID=3157089 RepID=UPI0034111599